MSTNELLQRHAEAVCIRLRARLEALPRRGRRPNGTAPSGRYE